MRIYLEIVRLGHLLEALSELRLVNLWGLRLVGWLEHYLEGYLVV